MCGIQFVIPKRQKTKHLPQEQTNQTTTVTTKQKQKQNQHTTKLTLKCVLF